MRVSKEYNRQWMRWKRGRGEHPAKLGMTNKFVHKEIKAKPGKYIPKTRSPWDKLMEFAVTYEEICTKNYYLKYLKEGNTKRKAYRLAKEAWQAQQRRLVWF